MSAQEMHQRRLALISGCDSAQKATEKVSSRTTLRFSPPIQASQTAAKQNNEKNAKAV